MNNVQEIYDESSSNNDDGLAEEETSQLDSDAEPNFLK